jgi:hypothetical protein
MQLLSRHNFKLAFIAAVLAGCGGGGGTSSGTGSNPPPTTGSGGDGSGDSVVLTAACTETSDYLCSGRDILRVDRRVALTENGVQVYGLSTSDLQTPNPSTTSAYGLTLPDCTSSSNCIAAEVRKHRKEKNVDGHLVLLLDNLDITWDRRNPRPMIIDTFSTRMGRATLSSDNVVRFSTDLPPPSNLDFYDYAVKFNQATQANYANNVYFPRDEPVRCPDDWPDCPDTESEGMKYGSSSRGGFDFASAGRYHGDGDLRAGDDTPDPVTGERRWIPDSDGFGSSYPGFKGYRDITNSSYQYANLANWFTQDTVEIVEFTDGSDPNEHNKERRGFVAFGDVTEPGDVPSSGTQTYAGIVFGQYVPNGTAEEVTFSGNASITVNYATRQATINVTGTQVYDTNGAPVPAEFTAVTTLDPADTGLTNYASGAVTSGAMQGGIGARLFGPASGNGAAEIGGTFSMENSATGQTAIGGFIARRQ